MDSTIKLIKNSRLEASVLPDGNWVLLEPASNEVVVLSPTAGIFWELCSGERELEAVIKEFSDLYPDQSSENIRQEVFESVRTMIDRELLFQL